jgi:hypothetical protein
VPAKLRIELIQCRHQLLALGLVGPGTGKQSQLRLARWLEPAQQHARAVVSHARAAQLSQAPQRGLRELAAVVTRRAQADDAAVSSGASVRGVAVGAQHYGHQVGRQALAAQLLSAALGKGGYCFGQGRGCVLGPPKGAGAGYAVARYPVGLQLVIFVPVGRV